MNKIRIGNDIRLLVALTNSSDWDKKNIKSIKAFLVNTSIKDFEEKQHDFPGRFPRDPQSKFFRPDCHCLNRCGYPHYHAMPCDRFNHHWWHMWHMDHDPNYVFDDGFHRPFWPHPFDGPCDPHFYHGFGLEPGRWPSRWFGWTRRDDVSFGHKSPFDGIPLHIGEDWTYLAPSREVKDKYVKADKDVHHQIEVFFPAQDQIACGTYKLILVITSYNSGWGRNNMHTYTQDCGNVFELVDDETGDFGDITLLVPEGEKIGKDSIDDIKIGGVNTEVDHYYISYTKYLGESFELGDTDSRGNLYQIYALQNGQMIQYEPNDKLYFSSNRPEVVYVDEGTGSMRINIDQFSKIADDPNAIITITLNETGETKKFMVTVIDPDAENVLIGFSHAGDLSDLDISKLKYYKKQNGVKFDIFNPEPASYLWVGSKTILKYIDNANPLRTVGVTSQRFPVPMLDAVYQNGRYWYRSAESLMNGYMSDINIEQN